MTRDEQKFVEGVRRLLEEPEASKIVEIYEQSGLLDDPNWGNVPLHCLRTAWVCFTLAAMLGLHERDRELVVTAALLHDVCKKRERERVGELVATGEEKGVAYAQAAQEQSAWLGRFEGISDAVLISGRSGHTSLIYFLAEEDRPVVEKLFHLADDLCGGERGDEVVMLADRIAVLRERYPFLIEEHPADLGGKCWLEVQERVSTGILDELATMTGHESGQALNAWLVEQFAKA